jgi:hypothetical protein
LNRKRKKKTKRKNIKKTQGKKDKSESKRKHYTKETGKNHKKNKNGSRFGDFVFTLRQLHPWLVQ